MKVSLSWLKEYVALDWEAGRLAEALTMAGLEVDSVYDRFAYLQDVYARLPTTPADQLESLLPDRWLDDHPEHLLPKRVQEAIERALRARERRAQRRAAG